MLSLSPLSHHIAWVGIAQWLVSGGRFVTDNPPRAKSRRWIMKSEATYLLGVPTHAMDILAQQKKTGLTGLGEMQGVLHGWRSYPVERGKRFPRTRGETPKCLRDDGEFVTSVHASG